jgi:hypothetical protein
MGMFGPTGHEDAAATRSENALREYGNYPLDLDEWDIEMNAAIGGL